MSQRREVRGDVGGVGGDGHRSSEVDLLPAGRGFIGEGGGGQDGSRRAPQVTDVGPGVAGALVEADTGDVAVLQRAELEA